MKFAKKKIDSTEKVIKQQKSTSECSFLKGNKHIHSIYRIFTHFVYTLFVVQNDCLARLKINCSGMRNNVNDVLQCPKFGGASCP